MRELVEPSCDSADGGMATERFETAPFISSSLLIDFRRVASSEGPVGLLNVMGEGERNVPLRRRNLNSVL